MMRMLKNLPNNSIIRALAQKFGIQGKRTQAYYDECANLWAKGQCYFNPRTGNNIYTQGDRTTIVGKKIIFDSNWSSEELYYQQMLKRLTFRTENLHSEPFNKLA